MTPDPALAYYPPKWLATLTQRQLDQLAEDRARLQQTQQDDLVNQVAKEVARRLHGPDHDGPTVHHQLAVNQRYQRYLKDINTLPGLARLAAKERLDRWRRNSLRDPDRTYGFIVAI